MSELQNIKHARSVCYSRPTSEALEIHGLNVIHLRHVAFHISLHTVSQAVVPSLTFMWMRALKDVTSHTAADEEEMLVCKLWITDSEGAITSSGVTVKIVYTQNSELCVSRKLARQRSQSGQRFGNRTTVGAKFPHHSRSAPGPTQPPVKWVPNLTSGDRAVSACYFYIPQSGADFKETVEF